MIIHLRCCTFAQCRPKMFYINTSLGHMTRGISSCHQQSSYVSEHKTEAVREGEIAWSGIAQSTQLHGSPTSADDVLELFTSHAEEVDRFITSWQHIRSLASVKSSCWDIYNVARHSFSVFFIVLKHYEGFRHWLLLSHPCHCFSLLTNCILFFPSRCISHISLCFSSLESSSGFLTDSTWSQCPFFCESVPFDQNSM